MKKHMMKKHILIICTTQNEKAFITKTLWWRSTQRRIWHSLYREAYEEAYDEESYDGARRQAETLLKTIRWAAKKLTNGACDCLHSAIDHCAKDCALFYCAIKYCAKALCEKRLCPFASCNSTLCNWALCKWALCKRCCTNGTCDCLHRAKDFALFHCEFEHCQISFQMNVSNSFSELYQSVLVWS